MTHIFEVIDYTDPDCYYTLGIFPALEDAEKAIEEKEEKNGYVSYATDLAGNEAETIVIRKRNFGWDEPAEIKRIEREKVLCEETDEYKWERV